MTEAELSRMVNQTAQRFGTRHGVRISPGSVWEVTKPALEHLDDVNRALEDGEVTRRFLADSVYIVFLNAWKVAQETGQDQIGERTTRASMKRYCPYLFWC